MPQGSSREKYSGWDQWCSGADLWQCCASYLLYNLILFSSENSILFWQILLLLVFAFFLLVSGKNICGDSNFYLFFLESHWEKEGVLVRGLSTVVEIHSSWKLARELSLQAKFVIFPCRLRKEYVWLCSCWRNAGKDREKKKRGKRNVCMIYGSPAAQSSTVLWPVAMKNQQQQGVNQRWIVRSIWALLCSSFL